MTWKKIKVLRSDNGGEYMDKDFTDFWANLQRRTSKGMDNSIYFGAEWSSRAEK